MSNTPQIFGAFWETAERGVAYLSADWTDDDSPPLTMQDGTPMKLVRRVEPLYFAFRTGYCFEGEQVLFVLAPPFYHNFDWEHETPYVAGDFNGWQEAVQDDAWRMKAETHAGLSVYVLRVPKEKVMVNARPRFKFVTREKHWVEIPRRAPNVVADGKNENFEIQPECTGLNLFYFWPPKPHRLGVCESIRLNGGQPHEVRAGLLLFRQEAKGRLGAYIEDGKTFFRVFVPRATKVVAHFMPHPHEQEGRILELARDESNPCVWQGWVHESLENWFYYYSIGGNNHNATTAFDPAARVMDPWARAVIGPESLGIILTDGRFSRGRKKQFTPPHWHDLVIAECHVRDLVKYAPMPMEDVKRRGFAGLAQCVRDPLFYLNHLGANAVELQPVQENDAPNAEAYHWGYMPVNYFAPASTYATDPYSASQIEQFRDLVDAFHEKNIAVILDVVYNHTGEPNHLLRMDKAYFFCQDFDGALTNFSGTGNDLRTYTPTAKRLIIESLTHLIQAYDVDGFRFDLADLIGVGVLKEIEQALKAVKPSVVLIAEPWSFRGNIARALRHTGFSSWNDGFREFVARYVLGNGNIEGLKYFLAGSPGLALWPAQTVNYAASHDDYCWIDKITENAGHNGFWPTGTDQRRTRLMFSVLMMALGIPMLAQGQDFLHSKHGVCNTYLDGEKNALNYARAREYSDTAAYARHWIEFRKTAGRELLCLSQSPGPGYLRCWPTHSSAAAFLYNADHSRGKKRLLYAINPHPWEERILLDGLEPSDFLQLADHNGFSQNERGLNPSFFWLEGKLRMPPLSCALFACC